MRDVEGEKDFRNDLVQLWALEVGFVRLSIAR